MSKAQSSTKAIKSTPKAVIANGPQDKSKPTKAQLAKAAKLFGQEAVLEQPKEEHVIVEEQRIAERRVPSAMDFAVQQLSNQPRLETPPTAIAEFNKDLEELKAKHNIQTKQVILKVSIPKIRQNGETRPSPTTLCGQIWAVADEISQQVHGVAPIALVKKHPSLLQINDHTIKTQYARWRKFNGVTGRLQTIQVQSTPTVLTFGAFEPF